MLVDAALRGSTQQNQLAAPALQTAQAAAVPAGAVDAEDTKKIQQSFNTEPFDAFGPYMRQA